MNIERSAGILMHPSSLPGRFGIGDIGPEAFSFIDFLERAGQTLWQVFPLGPTGYGDSPYQTFSTFAGNPILISPDVLISEGLLNESDVTPIPEFDPANVDFGNIINYKKTLLQKAYEMYKQTSSVERDKRYAAFLEKHNIWLEDFAFFMALKDEHNGEPWLKWKPELAMREESALHEWKEKVSDSINYHKFVQFCFFEQWTNVREYAHKKGINIIGDVPIFVAYDSSDVWANKSLFTVDEKGNLETVAGVPPDYFSETGQLWGNPLYRWDKMKENDFQWWRDRVGFMLDLVDFIRIDHFRGLEAFWEIPGDAPTAQTGKWVKAPGKELFESIIKHLGNLPIIAEDLGVITPEVEKLRDDFNLPGMKILQFAFGSGGEKKFLPHNFVSNCMVYTGSHDNDTTRGFFEKEKQKQSDVYDHTKQYMNYDGDDICPQLIRTAYASVANIVVIPMQDILNLGTWARMNFPGKLGGNWTWRATYDQINDGVSDQLKSLVLLYERMPKGNSD